jgi:hypothetical protein
VIRAFGVVVACALAIPATAPAADALPVLASATGIPQGWASFKIQTDGPASPIAIRTSNGGFQNGVSLGYSSFREDGTPLDSVAFTAYYARTWYVASSDALTGLQIHQEQTMDHYTAGSCDGCGWTVSTTNYPAGTYKFLIWVAGRPLKDWSYAVFDGPGVHLLATDAGTGAYFAMSEDFTGVAEAKAANAGAGARASVAVSKTIDVRDTLFAWYLQPLVAGCCQAFTLANPQANALSITTPNGEKDCNLGCTIRSFRDGDAERFTPGAYVFHVTGAGAGPFTDADDVTLIGADARLPA